MSSAKKVDALGDLVRDIIREQMGNMSSQFVSGTWAGAESVDANLSKVNLPGGGDQARFVPKGAHVTGLTIGDTVICLRAKGLPLTIMARTVGDIRLASI